MPPRLRRHSARHFRGGPVAALLHWPFALLVAVVLLALPASANVEPAVAAPNAWSPAGSMATPRARHAVPPEPPGRAAPSSRAPE